MSVAMLRVMSVLAIGLTSAFAQHPSANQYVQAGDTLVSAMMMFVGNEDMVYIMDKAEANPTKIDGHSVWASAWDFGSHDSAPMSLLTNSFCASGMHLPNGSYAAFGGNNAVGQGNVGPSQPGFDPFYWVADGGLSIRILNPCPSGSDFTSDDCKWFDDPTVLAMQHRRWYSTAEPLGTGEIVLIGGFQYGGYINRNVPNTDPCDPNGGAVCTTEIFPANGRVPVSMNFMSKTSGLNAYAHASLMASGKMFVQANFSTVLWDVASNEEVDLPDMPGQVIRVYPASGAVTMLPLTPANNYEPTILFCGGSDMPEPTWGNYSWPFINTWDYPASKDCQRITPEPQDGSAPQYVQDDDMIDGRTMGQFIILPDGTLFLVNGGLNGTAGYSDLTLLTAKESKPFGQSLASGPVLKPAIYNPNAPAGHRWSDAGLGTTQIPRLYHSSAILLPDASVLIGGSNPNGDVDMDAQFPTTYTAEIFYPPYFSATTRPVPQGVPKTLTYGGDYFNITIPPTSYSGSGNDAAENATVVIIRSGFTTHAMNMGQRYMQLANTYTVADNGAITLHVSQPYPNPNLFQPGPAFLYVNIHGIPSNGTWLIVGNGEVGQQPVSDAASLPSSMKSATASGSGSANGNGTNSNNSASDAQNSEDAKKDKEKTSIIIGVVVGGIALLGGMGLFLVFRHHSGAPGSQARSAPYENPSPGPDIPLHQPHAQQPAYNQLYGVSSVSLMNGQLPPNVPYRDDVPGEGRGSTSGMSVEYDPYTRRPMGHGV